MNYVAIVTGSRDWLDQDAVWGALEDRLAENMFSVRDFYVVHGGCPTGADAMAQAWVDYKYDPNIIGITYPADWDRLGRAAGPARNKLMIDRGADVALAFIRNNSSGASGCVRLAEKAGIPVSLVRIDDKEKRMTETKTKTTVVEPQHEDIAHALVAFQAEMKTVGKDKINPHFKSRYADIASITEDVMPTLTKHGLSFSCAPRSADNGYEIVGILLHESGERLEGALPLFGNDAQKIGSSITYARRYLLGCLTGVVTGDEADDDGNMASTTNERARREPMNRAAAAPQRNPEEILAEILATTTRADALALWAKHGLDGAPREIQDKARAHGLSLPE